MTTEEFKAIISILTPKWKMEGGAIWCPTYMTPQDGFVFSGGDFPQDKLDDTIIDIIKKNKGTRVTDDYVFIDYSGFGDEIALARLI